ncbi:hypothetical protein PENSUB_11430 [Penicillium subrubescens]|uniref:Uncharacterized protein n=1 Tax=Penicillium subrubescens TaxID=1316194 RepID=A0A1Q5UQC3_9EURO|nr:hypothetical protein PENSUB_11430 [Penicillium subrubescens]
MACMINFHLRNSATDLEEVSHPSHGAWYKTLAQLRDMGLDIPGTPTRDHTQKIAEYSYCCMDQENPRKVIYLYRESECPHSISTILTASAQCPDVKFQRIQAECVSETSTLNRLLSPLLESPISRESIFRITDGIGLIYPGADSGPKCLEFMTFHNPKRPMMLYPFLEPHWPGGSCEGLAHVPVRSFSTKTMESPKGEKILFCFIEWKSLEDRAALYADPSLRKQMKTANAAHRAPVIQALGKKEEDLTWEEELQVFFESTGATDIQRQSLTGVWVNEAYLGLEKDKTRKRGSCVIQ